MFENVVRPEIRALKPYVPGRSIDEIREEYGLEHVVKMASNENPLGVSNLVKEALGRHADTVFRYPTGGNPRLVRALAEQWKTDPARIVVGNGSDEIIDMLVRMLAVAGRDNVVCFRPCFSLYPIQSLIQGVEIRRQPVNADFSFDFDKLLGLVDENTRLLAVNAKRVKEFSFQEAASWVKLGESSVRGRLDELTEMGILTKSGRTRSMRYTFDDPLRQVREMMDAGNVTLR